MSDALLALSDMLVVRALERGYSRLPRSTRAGLTVPRHRVHERIRLTEAVQDGMLADAWALCPEYVRRWQLPVDDAAWAAALDGYTRVLLRTGRPHTLDGMAAALAPLTAVGRAYA